MEVKQTAVEWIESIVFSMITNGGDSDLLAVLEHCKKAKEMEKEQIVKFANDCLKKNDCFFDAEQYYNETFKSE